MFLTAVWILTKSAFVEGILDGSVLTTGKAVAVSANAFLETPTCFFFQAGLRTHTHIHARASASASASACSDVSMLFECVTTGGVVFEFCFL